MPGDYGNQYRSYQRPERGYRAVAAVTYTPGSVLQLVSADLQVFPDAKSVALPGTGANPQKVAGVVSELWNGFNGNIPPTTYASAASFAGVFDLPYIRAVTEGFHPAVFLDQSGTGAVTLTDGLPLIPSRATAGYAQGAAATYAGGASGVVGSALLPASGIGSSLTAPALAQASQADTLTGTPAAGDTLSVTISAPYIRTAPGVAQTITWTTPPLTTAQAATVTTAALALLTYLNAQASFNQYFVATQAAGVVTITVNALSNPFAVNFGTGTTVASEFTIGISGMVANSLTFAVASTGGTVSTAGAANLAGGTGYKGTVPAIIATAGTAGGAP